MNYQYNFNIYKKRSLTNNMAPEPLEQCYIHIKPLCVVIWILMCLDAKHVRNSNIVLLENFRDKVVQTNHDQAIETL